MTKYHDHKSHNVLVPFEPPLSISPFFFSMLELNGGIILNRLLF